MSKDGNYDKVCWRLEMFGFGDVALQHLDLQIRTAVTKLTLPNPNYFAASNYKPPISEPPLGSITISQAAKMSTTSKDFPPMKNDLILRVARGEKVERAPCWIMRQ